VDSPEALPILPTSTEAARRRTITGWVSRDGRFYGDDERLARWAGATHVLCADCGAPTAKDTLVCPSCRERRAIATYTALPTAAPGSYPVYAEATDTFYANLELAEDDLESGQSLADLRLLVCEPVMARPLDTDYWLDDIPVDEDIPPGLLALIDAANAILARLEPLGYRPTRIAADPDHQLQRPTHARPSRTPPPEGYTNMTGDLVVVQMSRRTTHAVHATGNARDGSLHGQFTYCGLRLAGSDQKDRETGEKSNYHELANGSEITCKRCRKNTMWRVLAQPRPTEQPTAPNQTRPRTGSYHESQRG